MHSRSIHKRASQSCNSLDNHTPEQRRKNMKAIRCKDTEIELMLRKELWSRGLRYQKNCKSLPGKPDLVFKGAKVAVFCDSEFWHGFDWENQKKRIGSKREYWIPKIERNIQRDCEVNELLKKQGYRVIRFWGKEIKTNLSGCADLVENTIRANEKRKL